MPIKQQKVLDLLASAKNSTVPSRQNFEEAWEAIPDYREYMRHEVMARSSYTIDDQILTFLKNRIQDIREISVLTVDGITIVFEYVYGKGKYVIRLCEEAIDSVTK